MVGHVDFVVRVGVRNRLRGRGFQRRFAVRHLCLFAHFLIGHFVHAYLSLGRILLIFLSLFGVGLGVLLFGIVLARGIRVLLFFGAVLGLIFLIIVQFIRVVAQLIAISQIADHLPCKAREFRLV